MTRNTRVGLLLVLVFALGVLVGEVDLVGKSEHALASARHSVTALTASPRDVPKPAGPNRRAQTPEGLVVWAVDDSTKVFPGDSLETPWSAASGPVRLEGARGETVAIQLVLATRQGSPRVEVEVLDLEGRSGPIPARQIEVFLESYVPCPPVEDKVVSLGPGEYPDALLPLWEDGAGSRPVAAGFSLPAERNQPLWVDVTIPRDAAPGTYRGSVKLHAEGLPAVQVGIEVETYPFEIPVRRSLVAWVPLYATRLWSREQLDDLDDQDLLEILWKYFRMAHRHRFDTQIKEDEPDTEFDRSNGAMLGIDWQDYDHLNGPALDGSLFEDGEPPRVWKVGGGHWWGIRPGDPPNFGDYHKTAEDLNPAHRRALEEYAKAIANHFEARGWSRSRLFMYPVDEPNLAEHPNYARLVRAYGEVLRSTETGIGQLVTMAPYDSPEPVGYVDIWAAWGGGYFPRQMAKRQELGEETWFYQHHEPFVGGNAVNVEGLAMRSWAWIAWRYKVDGVFLWAGNFWNEDPYRDPENWSRNLLGNGIFFYPGALTPTVGVPRVQGPISSFRMKAFRRGLLDYEYFELLRSLGGDPDPLVESVVRSALNDEETDRHWQHSRWEQHGDWSHDPADWDAVRREVAAEIIKRRAR